MVGTAVITDKLSFCFLLFLKKRWDDILYILCVVGPACSGASERSARVEQRARKYERRLLHKSPFAVRALTRRVFAKFVAHRESPWWRRVQMSGRNNGGLTSRLSGGCVRVCVCVCVCVWRADCLVAVNENDSFGVNVMKTHGRMVPYQMFCCDLKHTYTHTHTHTHKHTYAKKIIFEKQRHLVEHTSVLSWSSR